MAKNQYKYVVTITTKRGNSLNGVVLDMPYSKPINGHADAKTDRVEIQSTSIRITAFRSSSSSDPKSIIEGEADTLHMQIIKQVVLYYASNFSNAEIKGITIVEYHEDIEKARHCIPYTSSDEPLRNFHWHNGLAFNSNDLSTYIKDDFDNYGVILSYWLTGIADNDTYSKFENLWRCFEQLSFKSYHGANKRPQDKDALISIRSFIRSNSELFPQSCDMVHNMNATEFRNNFSWRLMILNNYSQFAKKEGPYKNYRDEFVLPYTDVRVLNMLRQTLPYREKKLKSFNVYNGIVNHLDTFQPQGIVKDEDLVAILCGTMANYKRNKMFHGEILSPSISLNHTKEDEELKFLNSLLEMVDFELINCYKSL